MFMLTRRVSVALAATALAVGAAGCGEEEEPLQEGEEVEQVVPEGGALEEEE